jgi:hypothetical protein
MPAVRECGRSSNRLPGPGVTWPLPSTSPASLADAHCRTGPRRYYSAYRAELRSRSRNDRRLVVRGRPSSRLARQAHGPSRAGNPASVHRRRRQLSVAGAWGTCWCSAMPASDQLRQTIFCQPPHDIKHHQPVPWTPAGSADLGERPPGGSPWMAPIQCAAWPRALARLRPSGRPRIGISVSKIPKITPTRSRVCGSMPLIPMPAGAAKLDSPRERATSSTASVRQRYPGTAGLGMLGSATLSLSGLGNDWSSRHGSAICGSRGVPIRSHLGLGSSSPWGAPASGGQ